jgi:uncharacterized repeat protein (TIGR01451 family)
MARFLAVVRIALFTTGLAACGGGSDFPITPPAVPDAAVDADVDGHPGRDAPPADGAPADARVDAAPAVDAPPHDAPPGADLAIAISDRPDPVAASSTLTYTIDIDNLGELDAADVTVTQRLPGGNVQYQTATGIGWACSAAGQIVTCTRATLLTGAAPSIAVLLTTPPSGGPISTSVAVASQTSDTDLSNNDASASSVVLTPADLAIAITDGPDPVAAGGTLSYAITASNAGPGAAAGISVLDSLPGGVAFVSASGAGWSCSAVAGDVTCALAALAANASSVITLVVTAPTSGGIATNTAQVGAITPDGNAGNNQAATSTTVNAAADLALAVTASPTPVLANGTLQYALDVTNLGPNAASGITVTDSLPAGNVVFVSASGSGWTCALSGQVVSCTRPSLLVGAAPTIAIVVRVPSEATLLVDTATVASTSSDLTSANNGAMVTSSVASAADLSVDVIDAPDPATTNGALSYTVTASNAGPSQATSVVVTSLLPAGATFQSATGAGWLCQAIGQQVTCVAASLAIGTAPAIAIAATAPGSDGTATETSSISASTIDPVPGNNSASETTAIDAPSDLALALTGPLSVPAHAALTYTIGITNLGPRDATNLVVTDRLPDGNVLFLGAGGIGWTCALAGQIVTCTRPTLLVGVAPSIQVQILTPDDSGALVDQASVTASTTDQDTASNAASLTTNVFDSADLSIAATETPDPVRIGVGLGYTLSVANDGPTAATAVSVVDTLPPGTGFVSADGPGWSCSHLGQVVTCTMASLASGSSAPAIAIAAAAPGNTGNITNLASVSSATSDPDGTNNAATTTTLVNLFADLAVSIVDSPDPVQGTAVAGCGNNACVTYTIDVVNNGPDLATAVKVVTLMPLNGTFFEAVGSGWVCPAPVAGFVTCTRGLLGVGQSAPSISFTWKAPNPGGFSIVATPTVSATSTDPDASNNTATEDTTVRP